MKLHYYLTLGALFLLVSNYVVADEIHKNFFISINGKDSNSGTQKKPFKTFEAAQKAVRSFHKKNPLTPITVYFRKGIYYRNTPLLFSPIDNGSKDAPISYSSFPKEPVIITGSIPLHLKWQKSNDSIYYAKVPKGLLFETLYINNKKQILARYPNYNSKASKYNGTASDCISKEHSSGWKNPKGGYLHVMHNALWGDFHFQITGKKKDGEIELKGGWQNNRKEGGLHKEFRFVENIYEELDAPKEWYLNRLTSTLYYFPPKNTDISKAKVEVTTIENLIRLEGTHNNPLKYITINGIKFTRTSRTFMKTQEPLLRSDWTIYRGGTCFIENTENCSITNCEFQENGGNAIFVSKYNKKTQIYGCHIHDIGASAICFVGNTSAVRNGLYDPYGPITKEKDIDHTHGTKNDDFPINCKAENNLIHDIGLIEKQVAGVQISVAQDITVSHNSIYNCPRSGINVSEGAFGGHLIAFNDVFNTVLETSDHGSFNSWGRDRYWMANNTLTEKIVEKYPELIHADQLKPITLYNNRMKCEHGWDIDLDDGSSNYIIMNNLCLHNGIKLREGYYRRVENNICINNSIHPHVWLKNNNDIIRNNILGTNFYPIRVKYWGREIDYNWFLSSKSLLKNQEWGIDKNSQAGDPLFINAEEGNFNIKPESKVWCIGFKNFPMDKFGVQIPRLKSIAKTPKIPRIHIPKEIRGKTEKFNGGLIKNIENDNEVSATGMYNKRGVIFIKKPQSGILHQYPLKNFDVLLKINKTPINKTQDLLKYNFANTKIDSLIIWRNQQKKILKQEIIKN